MLAYEFRVIKAVFFLCALSLAAAAVAQQAPAAATQTSVPMMTVSTHEVLLDVLVTDANRNPVTGLTAADFTVTEEGAPQQIRSLEEHRPMSAADVARLKAAPALPPNTFTNFTPVVNTNASTVILLDALDTPVAAQMFLRQQLIEYLKQMQPGASIAIFQLDTDLHLIQGFSSDQRVLLDAAKSKRDSPSLAQPAHGTPEEFRRVKREILRAGLQMLGHYLAGFPGRKNLIWFTGEAPLTWYANNGLGTPFRDSFEVVGGSSPEELNDLTGVLTISRVAIYPVDARGLETLPQYDAGVNRVRSNHAGMGFISRQATNQFDLENVAAITGGKAYFNTNGLKQVIAEVVNNGSSYYTLAYTTTNKEWNGQFRHIKINIDRPGLAVQCRQGYYAVNRDKQEQRQLAALAKHKASAAAQAPQAEETLQTEEDRAPEEQGTLIKHPAKGGFDASMALGAIPPTELIFTATVTPSDKIIKLDRHDPLPQDNYLRPAYKDKPYRTYSVHVEAAARKLKLTQSPDGIYHGTFVCVAVVYDQSGETVNSLEKTALLDLNETSYQEMLQAGLPITTEIAIPVKGNYFLRIGVHDLGSDAVGALEIPVDEVTLTASR